MRTSAPTVARRRPATLALLTSLAVASGIGLTVGLSAPWPSDRPDGVRSLTAAEARRLATMRVTNHRDGGAGIRATLGRDDTRIDLVGWLDWRQHLAYLSVGGPGAGADRGLVQAVPGVLVRRPATAAAPPAVPPADGWRVRRADPAGYPLDGFLALLFGLAADRPDPAESLARGRSRWVGRDQAGGVTVDVLLAPGVPTPVGPVAPSVAGQVAPSAVGPTAGATVGPPASTTSPASPSPGRTATPPAVRPGDAGTVRYWLDEQARLRRFEAALPGGVPVEADLDRDIRPSLVAVDALGGRPVRPRAVTDEEADRLAGMRPANRARGGAHVELRLSTVPAANLSGAGWLDWRAGVAYVALRDLDQPATLLVRADRRGIASRAAPERDPGKPDRDAGNTDRTPDGGAPDPDRTRDTGEPAPLPPLPPPAERRWTLAHWQRHGSDGGALDLDLLISEGLAAGRRTPDNPAAVRATAVWLRTDRIGGRQVTVFEMPKPAEAGVPPGQARFRYWVDEAGLLRRLELRTRTGAFAQLDLALGRVPYLAPVPTR